MKEKSSFLYRLARAIALPLFSLLFGLEFRGRENIPESGAYIVCANHMSLLDPIFITAAMKRQVHYLTKIEVFKKPIVRKIALGFGAIPINRGIADMTAIRAGLDVLGRGRCLGIFPQGTRWKGYNPSDTPIKSGIGLFAYRTKANVLPVNIKTRGYRLRLFSKVTVSFGKPVMFSELGMDKGDISDYYDASKLIFGKICEAGNA